MHVIPRTRTASWVHIVAGVVILGLLIAELTVQEDPFGGGSLVSNLIMAFIAVTFIPTGIAGLVATGRE